MLTLGEIFAVIMGLVLLELLVTFDGELLVVMLVLVLFRDGDDEVGMCFGLLACLASGGTLFLAPGGLPRGLCC